MRLRNVARVLIVTAVSLTLPALASAQAAPGETTYGVKAGINISSLTFDFESDTIKGDGRAGFLGGFFVARDFNPRAGIQVEALFSQKGSEFDAGEIDDLDASFNLTYIEFPTLARINFPVAPTTVRVLAGPTFAFHVNETIKLGGEELDADAVPLKTFEMGFAIGGAVEFRKFIVDARYIWGFTDVLDEEDDDAPSVKNRTFSISFGYRFK